jgi:uncharacterized protein (TIGR03437 family)
MTGLTSAITPGQPSAARILGIMNAAGAVVSGRISPSEVISIFGFGLGPSTPMSATPNNGLFPTDLAGVQVLLNGSPIPLLYVSPSQINAEIPEPLYGMDNAAVQVIYNSAMLPDFRVELDPSIFGVFSNPDGTWAAVNQDGTVNSSSNPARAGTIVGIWATGFANVSGPVNGAVTKVANNWCADCQVLTSNGSETVQYAGAAPGLIDGIMHHGPAPIQC